MFDDTLTLELDFPLKEEQLDAILDIDMEHSVNVTFHTKNGKEVEFEKRKKGEWESNHDGTWNCSECGLRVLVYAKGNFCPNCGSCNCGKESEERS